MFNQRFRQNPLFCIEINQHAQLLPFQLLPPGQEGEFDQEADAHHDPPQFFDDFAGGRGGSAGGPGDRQRLKRARLSARRPGAFRWNRCRIEGIGFGKWSGPAASWACGGDEAQPLLEGHGAAQNEAARFDAGDFLHLVVLEWLIHLLHSLMKGRAVLD